MAAHVPQPDPALFNAQRPPIVGTVVANPVPSNPGPTGLFGGNVHTTAQTISRSFENSVSAPGVGRAMFDTPACGTSPNDPLFVHVEWDPNTRPLWDSSRALTVCRSLTRTLKGLKQCFEKASYRSALFAVNEERLLHSTDSELYSGRSSYGSTNPGVRHPVWRDFATTFDLQDPDKAHKKYAKKNSFLPELDSDPSDMKVAVLVSADLCPGQYGPGIVGELHSAHQEDLGPFQTYTFSQQSGELCLDRQLWEQRISPEYQTLYRQLYRTIESLLIAIAPESPDQTTGAKPLFKLCLKMLPSYVKILQNKLLREDPTSDRSVAQETYDFLEETYTGFGGPKNLNGWKGFKNIALADAMNVVAAAILGGHFHSSMIPQFIVQAHRLKNLEWAKFLCIVWLHGMKPSGQPIGSFTIPIDTLISIAGPTSTTLKMVLDTLKLFKDTNEMSFYFGALDCLVQANILPIYHLLVGHCVDDLTDAFGVSCGQFPDTANAIAFMITVLAKAPQSELTDEPARRIPANDRHSFVRNIKTTRRAFDDIVAQLMRNASPFAGSMLKSSALAMDILRRVAISFDPAHVPRNYASAVLALAYVVACMQQTLPYTVALVTAVSVFSEYLMRADTELEQASDMLVLISRRYHATEEQAARPAELEQIRQHLLASVDQFPALAVKVDGLISAAAQSYANTVGNKHFLDYSLELDRKIWEIATETGTASLRPERPSKESNWNWDDALCEWVARPANKVVFSNLWDEYEVEEGPDMWNSLDLDNETVASNTEEEDIPAATPAAADSPMVEIEVEKDGEMMAARDLKDHGTVPAAAAKKRTVDTLQEGLDLNSGVNTTDANTSTKRRCAIVDAYDQDMSEDELLS